MYWDDRQAPASYPKVEGDVRPRQPPMAICPASQGVLEYRHSTRLHGILREAQPDATRYSPHLDKREGDGWDGRGQRRESRREATVRGVNSNKGLSLNLRKETRHATMNRSTFRTAPHAKSVGNTATGPSQARGTRLPGAT